MKTRTKRYKLFYEPRYGYGIEFTSEVEETLSAIITKNEDNEVDWDECKYNIREKIGHGVIDDFGTDMVTFERWFGYDDLCPYEEGEECRFPKCVKDAAETIMECVNDYIATHKSEE